jgi:hypothetical protein
MKKRDIVIISCIVFFLLAPVQLLGSATMLPALSILCPAEVDENDFFTVTITSNNTSLANATVTFNGETNLTNTVGIVTFQAPRVVFDENNSYPITASKEGYNTTTASITILNVPQLFSTVLSTYLTENTTFVVTVVDEQGRIIDNATITFEATEYTTDENGTVTLQTPLVRKSETYFINVTKNGYLPNSLPIVVSPRPTPQNILGFLIFIGICFIIVIASLVILISRHLKRRRINRI